MGVLHSLFKWLHDMYNELCETDTEMDTHATPVPLKSLTFWRYTDQIVIIINCLFDASYVHADAWSVYTR